MVGHLRHAFLLLVLIVGAMAAVTARTSAAQTPGPCVPIESQSWWSKDSLPGPGAMQHVHAGACFPYKQVISGNYVLAVTVKMHNEQGRYVTHVRVDDATDQDDQIRFTSPTKNLFCGSIDCTFTVEVTVPTDSLPAGMHEWRVAASTAPKATESSNVAERNLATSGWQVCIRSCSGRTPAVNRAETRGWYRTATSGGLRQIGYNTVTWGWEASHDAEFPWNPGTGDYVPISGVWAPPLSIHTGATDGVIEPLTRSRCWVDPDFHHGLEGVNVLDQLSSFKGRLSIDTRQFANGMHKLVCAGGSSVEGFLDGVYAMPFMVSNSGSPGTPPPSPGTPPLSSTPPPSSTPPQPTSSPAAAGPPSVKKRDRKGKKRHRKGKARHRKGKRSLLVCEVSRDARPDGVPH